MNTKLQTLVSTLQAKNVNHKVATAGNRATVALTFNNKVWYALMYVSYNGEEIMYLGRAYNTATKKIIPVKTKRRVNIYLEIENKTGIDILA